jgi:hypothetical protein
MNGIAGRRRRREMNVRILAAARIFMYRSKKKLP